MIMRSLSIRSKLLAMLLLAGIFCLAAGGLIADWSGGAALQAAVFNQMTSLRESKRSQMEDYLYRLERSIRLLSQTPTTARAMVDFAGAFRQLNEATAQPPSAELVKYYRDEFLPRLARMSNGVPSLEAYMPAGAAARKLQTEYIARNAYKAGDKDRFLTAPGGSVYDVVHAAVHPFFLDAVEQYRIEDIMLIDAQSGDVVYAVDKQEDFATNLRTGPYARTGLARAFERALDAHDVGAVIYESFSAYPPAELAPTAFMSAPIAQDGITVGVVVIQLSIGEIDHVMTSDHHWADIGLGKTGSAYLVGPEQRARSDDREMIENKPAFLKRLAAAGVDSQTIARIDAFNTMVLYLTIDTDAARAALRGESGTGVTRDYFHELVLSSWAPVTVGGVHWGVIAEMDAAEAFAPQVQFRNTLLLVAGIAAIALTLVSLLWASSFVRPIREILAGVKTLGEGNDETRIPVKGHDEFSELAQAFNTMAEEIANRNARIHEKTAEYEGLLRNIYPELVAERVKLGQTSISEVVRNVTVLVLNIDGVNALFESTQHDTVAIMNQIIDAFDEAAARHGIEKLKTMGESYFAASGLTTPRLDHATRAVAFAEEACRILDRLRRSWNLPFELRAGIASGDVEAGLIGRQRTIYDLWGSTMVVARRIVFEASSYAIRITAATRDLLGDANGFEPMPPIQTGSLGEITTFERPAFHPAMLET